MKQNFQLQYNCKAALAKVAVVALFFSNTIKAHEDHDHEHEHEQESSVSSSEKFTIQESWLYGMLTGVMLGILGLICSGLVVILKKYTKVSFNAILKILIAFAAGALIGDAVVHLLPHAFAPHSHGEEASAEHDHDHEHEAGEEAEQVSEKLLSFFVCFGIVTFALIERLFHMLGIGHSHGEKEGDHHHHDGDHHHHHESPENNKNHESPVKKSQVGVEPQLKQGPSTLNFITSEINCIEKKDSNEEQFQLNKNGTTNEIPTKAALNNSDEKLQQPAVDLTKGWKNKKPEGYLNLIGDFLHNIMDGIALGVSFTSSSKSTAASTVVAIIAHEIPQEMGDVSILLNSNFSGLQAILCNGIINFSGLVGIMIGIAVASMSEKSERLMNCFIAGNFLYIGAAEMLPKISEEKSNKVAFLQIFSLCVGFGIMFLITLSEKDE